MDYYLYSEDTDKFEKEKGLPKNEKDLQKNDVVKFEEVKKGVKSKYYIGQQVVDVSEDTVEDSNNHSGETSLEEDGWYKVIYQNCGRDSENSTWWIDSNISTGANKFLWLNTAQTKYVRFKDNLQWEAGNYKNNKGKISFYPHEVGFYTIYNQIITLYDYDIDGQEISLFHLESNKTIKNIFKKNPSPEETCLIIENGEFKTFDKGNKTTLDIYLSESKTITLSTKSKKYNLYGNICLNFFNIEDVDSYGIFEIISRNKFLSSEKLVNDYFSVKKEQAVSYAIPFDGIEKNKDSLYYKEYERNLEKNMFTREYFDFNTLQDEFTSHNSRSVGYFEDFLLLEKGYKFKYAINNGEIKLFKPSTIHSFKSSDKVYQLSEFSNFDRVVNTENNKKSPLENTGIVLDKFGVHKYNKPKKASIKLIFLGKNFNLVTLNYKILGSKTEVLQKKSISLPRNSKMTYHFTYSDNTVQVSRGKKVDSYEMHVYSDGKNTIEKKDKKEGITENGILYKFQYSYTIKADLDYSYAIKKYKDKKVEIIPISDISHIKRISRISEQLDFKVSYQDYDFIFKEEPKSYQIYFDKSRVENIKSIIVNDIDILKNHYEVPQDSEGNNWAKIIIKYDKPKFGLVRDITILSSGLAKLLDNDKAYWNYNGFSQEDEIYVNLNNDLFLDLSYKGNLYLTNIVYTLDKGVSGLILDPMRLKIGKLPYIFKDLSKDSSKLYFTEGEQLYLDCSFVSTNNLLKQVKIDATKSSLPVIHHLYDENRYVYNVNYIPEQVLKDINAEDPETRKKAIKDASILLTEEKKLNLDLYKLIGVLEGSTWYRKGFFQTLYFKTQPLDFIINLNISFKSYFLTIYPDFNGILKPTSSHTYFSPGDIIKITYTIDRDHRVSTNTPTISILESHFSTTTLGLNRGRPTSFKQLYELLVELSKYSNLDSKLEQTEENKNKSKRILFNEKMFSFYVLNKDYKNPHNLSDSDPFLGCYTKMSETRKNFEIERSTKSKFLSYLKNNNKAFMIAADEEIYLYLIGGNSDIDLFLSSELYENNNIYKLSNKNAFYKIEQSGYYLMFLAGSRCGNGGDGIEGMSAGNGDVLVMGLACAGFPELKYKFRGPHPDHYKDRIPEGSNILCFGKPGGSGGDGWIGGSGGKGGEGSLIAVQYQIDWYYIKISIWKWTIKIYLFPYFSLAIIGGKSAGKPGKGGVGYAFKGTDGAHGHCMTIEAVSRGIGPENSMVLRSGKAVVNRFFKKVFLKKGTILFINSGENGKDGYKGDVHYIVNDKKTLFTVLNSKLIAGPDGLSGTPGLPSCIKSINNDITIIDQEGPLDKNFIYVEGISIGKEVGSRCFFSTTNNRCPNWLDWGGNGNGDTRLNIVSKKLAFFRIYGCNLMVGSEMKGGPGDAPDYLINTNIPEWGMRAYTNPRRLLDFKVLFNAGTKFWGSQSCSRKDWLLNKKSISDIKTENEIYLGMKYGGTNPSIFRILEKDLSVVGETDEEKQKNENKKLAQLYGYESLDPSKPFDKYKEIISNNQVGYDASGFSLYFLYQQELEKEGEDYKKLQIFREKPDPLKEEYIDSDVLLGEYF